MANYEGGSVEIQIKSTADKARASLEALSGVVKQIKGDFQGLIPVFASVNKMANGLRTIEKLNMSKVSSQVEAVGQALGKMSTNLARTDLSGFNTQSEQAAFALNRLTNSFRQLDKLQQIDTRRVYQDLDRLGRISSGGIEKLSTALKAVDLTSIKAAGTSINTLVNGLQKIQGLKLDTNITGNLKSQLDALAPTLTSFLQQLQGINTEGLRNLASALKSLPKSMESMQALDTTRLGEVFTTLSTQIQPFLSRLKEASAELQAFATISKNLGGATSTRAAQGVDKVKASVQRLGTEAKKTKPALDSVFSIGKIYFFINYTRRAVEAFGRMLKSAIDFIETENLFTRAMGSMRTEAIRFQNTLSETFGLALPDLMKSQALFKNIVSQLGGINEEISYGISETLTKMALDFSALYNVGIDKAMDTFQAAMTGQVKPVRRIAGMDITQQTLQGFLDQAGIDRTVRGLNQIEKRLLTVYALQRQMAASQAMGNYAETVENAANQLKILSEQVKEFGRWLSAVFVGTISSVLPYLNGFVMVLKEIAKTLAMFVGYRLPDSADLGDQLGLEETQEGLGGVAGGLEKIKQATTGIDELNIISPEQAGGGGAGGELVDPAILGLLTEYDNLMEDIRMKALDIRDAIMEWLGFTKQINALGEITWVHDADKLWDNLSKLAGVDLTPLRNALSDLNRQFDRLAAFVWTGLVDFYNHFLKPVGQWVLGEGLPRFVQILADGLAKVDWQKINDALVRLWEALAPFAIQVGEGLIWLWENFFVPIGVWTLNKFVPAFLDVLTAFFKAVNPIIAAVGAGLEYFYKNFLLPIGRWAGATIIKLLQFLAAALTSIGEWAQKHPKFIKTATIILADFFAVFLVLKTLKSLLKFEWVANLATYVLNLKNSAQVAIPFIKQMGTQFLNVLKANAPMLIATAIGALGIALIQHINDVRQTRVDKAYAETFGEAEVTVEEFSLALGTFSSEGTLALENITNTLGPNVDEWKTKFDESKSSFDDMVLGIKGGAITLTDETLPGILTSVSGHYGTWKGLNDAEMERQLAFWTEIYTQNDGKVDAGERQILNTIQEHYGTKNTEIDKLEGAITEIYKTHVDEQGRLNAEGILALEKVMSDMQAKVDEAADRAQREAVAKQEYFLEELAKGRGTHTEETYKNYLSAIETNEQAAVDKAAEIRAQGKVDADLLLESVLNDAAATQADIAAAQATWQSMINANDLTYLESVEATYAASTEARTKFDEALAKAQEGVAAKTKEAEDAYWKQTEATQKLKQEQQELELAMSLSSGRTQENKEKMEDLTEKIAEAEKKTGELAKAWDTLAALEPIKTNLFEGFRTSLAETQKETSEKAEQIGTDINKGIVKKLLETRREPIDTLQQTADQLKNIMPTTFDSHSPSKVTESQAGDFMQGLILGFENNLEAVKATAQKVVDSINQIFILGFGIAGGTSSVFSGFAGALMNAIAATISALLPSVVKAFKNLYNSIFDTTEKFANTLLKGLHDLAVQAAALLSIITMSIVIVPDITPIAMPRFAQGGFPEDGFFFANSTELIGSMSGRTAVANNDMIVAALEGGVERAMLRALAQQRQQPVQVTSVLQVDSREIARANNNGQQDLGTNPIKGAFANA